MVPVLTTNGIQNRHYSKQKNPAGKNVAAPEKDLDWRQKKKFHQQRNVIKIPELDGQGGRGQRIILFGVTFSPGESYDDYRRPLAHDESPLIMQDPEVTKNSFDRVMRKSQNSSKGIKLVIVDLSRTKPEFEEVCCEALTLFNMCTKMRIYFIAFESSKFLFYLYAQNSQIYGAVLSIY